MLARLPRVNTAISASNSLRRAILAVMAAINGAPTTTPSAYAEMTCPAAGSETPRPLAMSGSRPMATNSVVPMPNPPSASATTASQRTTGSGAAAETGPEARSSVAVIVLERR